MDKRGIHRFLELYDQGQFDAFEFNDEWSFGEVDEPTPDWIRDRIPPRRLDDDSQSETIAYPDYDIDEIFDYENNPNLPSVADLEEDRALTEDELDLLVDQYSDMVGEQGFEALAWYVPFHYATRDWGIYIKEEGIKILANLFYAWSHGRATGNVRVTVSSGGATAAHTFDGDPIPSRRTAAKLALEVLVRHEWFHHQVELLATYLEDLYERPLYRPYMENAYRTHFADEDCIEESLANAYVARSQAVRKHPPTGIFNSLFAAAALRQPEAYRRYERFGGDNFQTGCQHLAYQLVTPGTDAISAKIGDIDHQFVIGDRLPFEQNISQAAERGQVPITVLRPERRRRSVYYFKTISLDDFYTDYDIIRSDSFERAYNKADGSIKQRVDSQIDKLRESIHHSGFEWRPCEGGLSYLKINDQYRMIARRNDPAEEIELIDFSTDHDLPKEYNCYKNT